MMQSTPIPLPIEVNISGYIQSMAAPATFMQGAAFLYISGGKLNIFRYSGSPISLDAAGNIIEMALINNKVVVRDDLGQAYELRSPINGDIYLKHIGGKVVRVSRSGIYKLSGYAYSSLLQRVVPVMNGNILSVFSDGSVLKTDGSNTAGVNDDMIIDVIDVDGSKYYLKSNGDFKKGDGTKIAGGVTDFGYFDLEKHYKDTIAYGVKAIGSNFKFTTHIGAAAAFYNDNMELVRIPEHGTAWDGVSSSKKSMFDLYYYMMKDAYRGKVKWSQDIKKVIWYKTDKVHYIGASSSDFIYMQDFKSYLAKRFTDKNFDKFFTIAGSCDNMAPATHYVCGWSSGGILASYFQSKYKKV